MALLDGLRNWGTTITTTEAVYSPTAAEVAGGLIVLAGRNGAQAIALPAAVPGSSGPRVLVVADHAAVSMANAITITAGALSVSLVTRLRVAEFVWTGAQWGLVGATETAWTVPDGVPAGTGGSSKLGALTVGGSSRTELGQVAGEAGAPFRLLGDSELDSSLNFAAYPGTGTTPVIIGGTITSSGTMSHPGRSAAPGGSPQVFMVTGSAAAGSIAGWKSGASVAHTPGSGYGGFRAVFRFAGLMNAAGSRGFVGLVSSASLFASGTEPASVANRIGLHWGTADSSVSVGMYGASIGQASSLGSNFPRPSGTAEIWTLILECARGNGGKLTYCVTRETGAAIYRATGGILASYAPASTQGLLVHAWCDNASTAAAQWIGCAAATVRTHIPLA